MLVSTTATGIFPFRRAGVIQQIGGQGNRGHRVVIRWRNGLTHTDPRTREATKQLAGLLVLELARQRGKVVGEISARDLATVKLATLGRALGGLYMYYVKHVPRAAGEETKDQILRDLFGSEAPPCDEMGRVRTASAITPPVILEAFTFLSRYLPAPSLSLDQFIQKAHFVFVGNEARPVTGTEYAQNCFLVVNGGVSAASKNGRLTARLEAGEVFGLKPFDFDPSFSPFALRSASGWALVMVFPRELTFTSA